MFKRSRPLLCCTATGSSFGAQHPTGRTAWVGCAASTKITASSADNWFIKASYPLMNAACFAGSNLREIAVGLRCSMPMRCSRAISPDRVWYSMPHSRAIHAPTARVVRGRVSAIQTFSLSCCSTVSRQLPVMAEARQTFDPVLLIEVVPGTHGVAVEQQYFGDRLTAHSLVQQQQRVGAAGQAVLGGTVPGQ